MKPAISIIIPVLNEENRINQTLELIEAQVFDAAIEIVVADGHECGTTLAEIKNAGVIKVFSPPGRGVQLNAGAAKASGDILLFLHCDTRLPSGALQSVKKVLQNPVICAGAFDLAVNSRKRVFRMIEKSASLRSRLTRIPYGDQAVFIRRNYFFDIGGFADMQIMEDVDLMRKIKKKGGRISILKQTVSTSARRWQKEGVLYTTLRNWVLLSLFFCGVKPEKLVKFYRPERRDPD